MYGFRTDQRTLPRWTVLALAASTLFVAVAAHAAIPDSGTGKVQACIRNTSGARPGLPPAEKGTARIIDYQAGERCKNGESAIDWNQQGAAGAAGGVGRAGPAGPDTPPIAVERWYDVNTSRAVFPVGFSPLAMAFDGNYLWVGTGEDPNSVVKLRPSDGTIIGTFNADGFADSFAFDGANVWVRNQFDVVEKLRASDGTVLLRLPFTDAKNVAFDGASIWVTRNRHHAPINAAGVLTKVRPSDGAPQATYEIGYPLSDIVSDGTNIWMIENVQHSDPRVIKLRASDGQVLGSFPIPGVFELTFDGANMWAISGATLTKLRASDGAVLKSVPIPGGPFGAQSSVFDGTDLWVASSDPTVTRINVVDGTILGTHPINGGGRVSDLAFDGVNVWVANYEDGTVTKL